MCTDSQRTTVTSIPGNTDVRRARNMQETVKICNQYGMRVYQTGVCNQMINEIASKWNLNFSHSESLPSGGLNQYHIACSTLPTWSE